MSDPQIPPPIEPVETKDGTGLNPSVAAGIACIFTILSGIIFLVIEKRDKFVRFWAMQALLLGVVGFVGAIVFGEAKTIMGFMPLIGGLLKLLVSILHGAFALGWFAVYIVCIVQAFSGKEWEIPWMGKISRKLLAKWDRENLPVT